MIKLFGVANHAPQTVIHILVKSKRATVSDISIVPVDCRISIKSPTRILLFLSVRDLFRNIDVLKTRKFEDVSCLIFANPLELAEIKDLQALDYAPSAEHAGFGFDLLSLDFSKFRTFKGCSDPKIVRGKYLSKLVNHVKKGSILNAFMTLIYTLPSAVQSSVKVAALTWLYSGAKESQLDKLFDSLGVALSTKIRKRFKDILFTDIGKSFQEAFRFYRESDSPNTHVVAKQFAIAEYEMNYIVSVVAVQNTRKSERFVDSFDKAKNRRVRSKK